MADDNKGAITTVDDDFLLDDIADLPAFATPPNGAYIVELEKGIENLEINGSDYYQIAMTIRECVDVAPKSLDEGEQMPKDGDIATVIFKRDNSFGMGNFKTFIASIRDKFATKTVGEVREAAKGLRMLVILKRKWNKENERYNMNVTKTEVL